MPQGTHGGRQARTSTAHHRISPPPKAPILTTLFLSSRSTLTVSKCRHEVAAERRRVAHSVSEGDREDCKQRCCLGKWHRADLIDLTQERASQSFSGSSSQLAALQEIRLRLLCHSRSSKTHPALLIMKRPDSMPGSLRSAAVAASSRSSCEGARGRRRPRVLTTSTICTAAHGR